MDKMINKKGSVWIWILVALIVLVILGVLAYVLMSGDSGSVSSSGSSFGGSLLGGEGSIPQPPALPD